MKPKPIIKRITYKEARKILASKKGFEKGIHYIVGDYDDIINLQIIIQPIKKKKSKK